MPAHITLRMQFGPHQDAQAIGRQLVNLIRVGRPDEIMFFYFAEELNSGYDTLDGVKRWIDHSRVYRDMAAAEGVAASLNPWQTLMHAQRGRRLKPGQDWQTLVSDRGEAAYCILCPLDPKWREYYAATIEMYARENFRVIWIDDDIRLHNHTPLGWGCFCPLHVAEFNRRTGLSATREQIVTNCTAPGEPHPWRKFWLDMWEETQLELMHHWRKIVQAHGKHLGLMTSCLEYHAAEGRRWNDWWDAVRGDTSRPLFLRPHFWGYEEMSHKEFPMAVSMLDQNRVVQPAGPRVENGPEVECVTYGRWNKSFRQIHAQMSLGFMLGATHLNVSLFDPMGNRPDDEPQRATFLGRARKTTDWLADLFPMSLRTRGVGCPISQEMSRRMRTERGGEWQTLVCPLVGWPGWLGGAGQAFSRRASDTVNALQGQSTWAFEDEELKRWLRGGLLLDGAAANILIQRGYSELIGLKNPRFLIQENVPYSFEHALDEAFALRPGADMSINKPGMAPRLFQAELLAGARAITDIRGPLFDTVGHGTVIFENAWGGRVAIVPWEAHQRLNMTAQRAVFLSKLLDWLDPKQTRGCVIDAAWVVPIFLTDGSQWRGVIWNVNPDAVEQPLRVRLPSDMPTPRQAVQVDANGNRHQAAFDAGRLTPARPLHQWEYVVLC